MVCTNSEVLEDFWADDGQVLRPCNLWFCEYRKVHPWILSNKKGIWNTTWSYTVLLSEEIWICNELFTWADVYDTANHDGRRAILQQFIKEIRVRKDYEISIALNASFNQVEQLKAVSTYDGAEIFEEISEKGA